MAKKFYALLFIETKITKHTPLTKDLGVRGNFSRIETLACYKNDTDEVITQKYLEKYQTDGIKLSVDVIGIYDSHTIKAKKEIINKVLLTKNKWWANK